MKTLIFFCWIRYFFVIIIFFKYFTSKRIVLDRKHNIFFEQNLISKHCFFLIVIIFGILNLENKSQTQIKNIKEFYFENVEAICFENVEKIHFEKLKFSFQNVGILWKCWNSLKMLEFFENAGILWKF